MSSFDTHFVSAPKDVMGFATWLQGRVHTGEFLGVAVRERSRKLALSGLDDCYVVDLKACPIAIGVIISQFLDAPGPGFGLLMRNAAIDLPELSRVLAQSLDTKTALDVCQALSPRVIGDMTAAAHVINQSVTKAGKFRLLEHNAYEVALITPQYEMGIAPYYTRVGLPLARLTAEQSLAGKISADWWVTYNWLWLRVLAGYTNDPTLTHAFFNQRAPLPMLATMFGKSEREAELMMLWQACGRDMFCVEKRFPSLVREMGDGPADDWRSIVDRSMPAMSSATAGLVKSYAAPWSYGGQPQAPTTTMFKRSLRPGAPAGEGMAFRVFGTVEELVSIAAVTFWQNRGSIDTYVRKAEGGPAEEVVRVIGSGPAEGKHQWMNELRMLAPLADPMGAELSLQPIVTEAPK